MADLAGLTRHAQRGAPLPTLAHLCLTLLVVALLTPAAPTFDASTHPLLGSRPEVLLVAATGQGSGRALLPLPVAGRGLASTALPTPPDRVLRLSAPPPLAPAVPRLALAAQGPRGPPTLRS